LRYWFVRSPYKTRKWEDVLLSGIFSLYGIRNHAAKNNINEMKDGDVALWYSSTAGKKVFGTMSVRGTAYPDNTSADNWLAIDFLPIKTFETPVCYTELKGNEIISKSNIIIQKRISVVGITKNEYDEVLKVVSRETT